MTAALKICDFLVLTLPLTMPKAMRLLTCMYLADDRVHRALGDVLLGVVPRAARVGRRDGHLHARRDRAREQAGDAAIVPKTTPHDDRREHHERARRDHLLQRRVGGDLDARVVVGAVGVVGDEQVGVEVELALDLLTIALAAMPTDFIVIAENQYGSIAPTEQARRR